MPVFSRKLAGKPDNSPKKSISGVPAKVKARSNQTKIINRNWTKIKQIPQTTGLAWLAFLGQDFLGWFPTSWTFRSVVPKSIEVGSGPNSDQCPKARQKQATWGPELCEPTYIYIKPNIIRRREDYRKRTAVKTATTSYGTQDAFRPRGLNFTEASVPEASHKILRTV